MTVLDEMTEEMRRNQEQLMKAWKIHLTRSVESETGKTGTRPEENIERTAGDNQAET